MSGDREDAAASVFSDHSLFCGPFEPSDDCKSNVTHIRLSDFEEGDGENVGKEFRCNSPDDLSTALHSTSGVYTAESCCSPDKLPCSAWPSDTKLVPPVPNPSPIPSPGVSPSSWSDSSSSYSPAVCQSMAISPPTQLVVCADRWDWARDDFREIDKIESLQAYLWNPGRRRRVVPSKSNDSFASTQCGGDTDIELDD